MEEEDKQLEKRKGIFNPKMVRMISFTIISLSLVVCTVLSILAIWDFANTDSIWRAVATFGVISFSTTIFTFVNEKL